MLPCWASINTRIWVSTTSHDQDDKKRTVFKSYKQMKNLQHTQLIVTIVSMVTREMYHPPKIVTLTIPSLIDVCGSNCRTYLKLQNFPSFRTPLNLLLVKNNRLLPSFPFLPEVALQAASATLFCCRLKL